MGMFRSAARGGQVTLPLTDGADELEELKKAVSSAPLQVTLEESRKEYATSPDHPRGRVRVRAKAGVAVVSVRERVRPFGPSGSG
jgi:hypothetical protein